jgi:hypothetical protein
MVLFLYFKTAIEVGVFPTPYVKREVRLPPLTLKDSIPAEVPWFPTNKYWPLGSTARKLGLPSVKKAPVFVELVNRVGSPVVELIEYTSTLPDPSLGIENQRNRSCVAVSKCSAGYQ